MSSSSGISGGIEAVIFDLDGVIFDSLDANIAFYNHILEHLGLEPVAENYREVIHRQAMQGSLEALVGKGRDYERAMAYWRTMDPMPYIRLLKLYPGAESTLRHLAGLTRMAVATNRTATAQPSLAHLGLLELFEEVVTPDHAGAAKPDPAMMYLLLDRMGLTPEQVVYVGDSDLDQEASLAAGLRFIAFQSPGLDRAWAHAGRFQEIPALLGMD